MKDLRKIAACIDHTLLKPEATGDDVAALCAEARRFGFAAVCVNPVHVAVCAGLVQGSDVKVATVIGFPLGAGTVFAKAFEARDAVANGADELDTVISLGAVKAGDYEAVARELGIMRAAADGKILKVILETGLLSDAEKTMACRLAREAGADFVKTSTGFGHGGATVEDVRLMRATVGSGMGVKASGGIRTLAAVEQMLAAGATRIGTSSSLAIMREAENRK